MSAPSDATMSVARANAVALAWLPVAGALVLVPFVLVWGRDTFGSHVAKALSPTVLVPVIAVSVVIHELLHAAGFLVFGRVPRSAVRLGIHRRTLTPYATCRVPVTAAAYRGAALLPAVTLGLFPGILGVALGSSTLALWGALMLAVAGGDLAAVWAIRSVPASALVVDHPTRVGCLLLSSVSERRRRTPGRSSSASTQSP